MVRDFYVHRVPSPLRIELPQISLRELSSSFSGLCREEKKAGFTK
ncbi:hypothetical protein LEP1GSC017_2916 [Leptospira meyeri serovar Hardjo str. Went 5]|nr:hypothetical protein LEP1GSC017_2916 [Leptospira meyeri serovar Hardjo str. Went 5]